jgi:hypothetical protein
MLLCDALRLVLVGVGAPEALNRLRLILGRPIRVPALGTEHLPKSLVLAFGDPSSSRILVPAKAQPTRGWEMVVLVRRRVIEGCLGVKGANSDAEGKITATTCHVVNSRSDRTKLQRWARDLPLTGSAKREGERCRRRRFCTPLAREYAQLRIPNVR